MQTQLIDKKLSILFEKYRDRDFAANAQKEVEDIRSTALKVGAVTSGAAFVLNELTRLSMRSRKFLIPQARNQSSFYSDFQAESSECPVLAGRSHRRQQVLLRLPHSLAH